MITIFKAKDRYFTNFGWSQVYRLFPSNTIHNPGIKHFGNILIVNDYTLPPEFGYDMHPHENLEQIFFVLQGELTHGDSLGNELVLGKNAVQRITAGSGYARSIYNRGKIPARYIGVWLMPKTRNADPAHEVRSHDPSLWRNHFYPVASDMPQMDGDHLAESIPFNAAATLYRVTVDRAEVSFPVRSGQKALLYCIDGAAVCNGKPLEAGDHARVVGEEALQLGSDAVAEYAFVLMRTDM